jgi:hypothetical protein
MIQARQFHNLEVLIPAGFECLLNCRQVLSRRYLQVSFAVEHEHRTGQLDEGRRRIVNEEVAELRGTGGFDLEVDLGVRDLAT